MSVRSSCARPNLHEPSIVVLATPRVAVMAWLKPVLLAVVLSILAVNMQGCGCDKYKVAKCVSCRIR